MEKERKKIDWPKIVALILFISLVGSIVYAIVSIIISPSEPSLMGEHRRVKSDYVLMLIQCMLGLLVMGLPSLIKKKWSAQIPNYMYIMYFVFLYAAIYLGEVRNFYYIIPFWDIILHCFSGAMLGALGFTLVTLINNAPNIKVQLSPVFVALFAFCFAVACGAIWEIYEFSIDSLLSLNMQKFAFEDGTPLVGQSGTCRHNGGSDCRFDKCSDHHYCGIHFA